MSNLKIKGAQAVPTLLFLTIFMPCFRQGFPGAEDRWTPQLCSFGEKELRFRGAAAGWALGGAAALLRPPTPSLPSPPRRRREPEIPSRPEAPPQSCCMHHWVQIQRPDRCTWGGLGVMAGYGVARRLPSCGECLLQSPAFTSYCILFTSLTPSCPLLGARFSSRTSKNVPSAYVSKPPGLSQAAYWLHSESGEQATRLPERAPPKTTTGLLLSRKEAPGCCISGLF